MNNEFFSTLDSTELEDSPLLPAVRESNNSRQFAQLIQLIDNTGQFPTPLRNLIAEYARSTLEDNLVHFSLWIQQNKKQSQHIDKLVNIMFYAMFLTSIIDFVMVGYFIDIAVKSDSKPLVVFGVGAAVLSAVTAACLIFDRKNLPEHFIASNFGHDLKFQLESTAKNMDKKEFIKKAKLGCEDLNDTGIRTNNLLHEGVFASFLTGSVSLLFGLTASCPGLSTCVLSTSALSISLSSYGLFKMNQYSKRNVHHEAILSNVKVNYSA